MNGVLVEIIKNISVITIVVFVITQCKPFRRAINQSDYDINDKGMLIVVFGILSAMGNYINVPIEGQAMVHTRLIGTIIGGIFGGPVVGLGAGFIGMLPRMFISVSEQNVVIAAMLVNVLIGGISGCISYAYEARRVPIKIAFMTAIAAEIILKGTVLWQTYPLRSFEIERSVAMYAIIATCLGVMLSVYIIHSVYSDEDNVKAKAARKVIEIILKTRGIFRYKGFTYEAAECIAKTMYSILTVDYVGICLENQTWVEYAKEYTKRDAENSIRLYITVGKKKVATIVLSRPGLRQFHSYEHEWLQEFADFLSLELYQAELDKQTVLLSQAELNVLKSQIRPHFIFNMLSNIKAIISTEPEGAKELICDLSSFLRGRLRANEVEIAVVDELEAVETYVRLEKARYKDRLKVVQFVEPSALGQKIPYFSIQMLVENAVKHGIFSKKEGGTISIHVARKGGMLSIVVADDGVGMSKKMTTMLNHLDKRPDLYNISGSTGIGIKNIHDRLYTLYGGNAVFHVKSAEGRGTAIELRIPWRD